MLVKRFCVLIGAVLTTAAAAPHLPVAQNGTRTWKGHDGRVVALCFSSDGTTLASGGLDGKILLRRTRDGKVLAAINAHPGGVYSLAFAPTGNTLASTGADGLVNLWDASTGKAERSLKGHKGKAAAVAFSPDARTLASGGYDGLILLWDTQTGKVLRQLKGHKGRVTSLAFSPDGRRLLSGGTVLVSRTYGNGSVISTGVADTLRLWTLAGQDAVAVLPGAGSSVTFSPDGKTVAGAGLALDVQRSKSGIGLNGASVVCLIDVKSGQLLREIKGRGETATFSPDGKTLATAPGSYLHFDGFGVFVNAGDRRIFLHDIASGRTRLRLPQKYALTLAFSPDGKTLAASSHQGEVTLWDLEQEKRNPTADPDEIITPPPADNKLLVALDRDFQQLLKKDRDPNALRQANKLLNQSNRSEHMWNYRDALTILRKSRSRAAIPLLLRYAVEHQGPGDPAAYADTITILTGRDVRFRGRARSDAPLAREAVPHLVETWWEPEKDEITTDLASMSPAQLRVIVDRLLEVMGAGRRDNNYGDPEIHIYRLLDKLSDEEDLRRSFFDEDLTAAMLPLLLAPSGYQVKPRNGQLARKQPEITYAAVPLLAALRKKGQAPQLDRIASDKEQPFATRLTCLLALHYAGVRLRSEAVLPILQAEKKLDERIVAIRLLGYCQDVAETRKHLIELLDASNVFIRNAALRALLDAGPDSTALPRLKELLEDGDRRRDERAILQAVAKIGTVAATDFLAGLLRERLGGQADRLSLVVYAFEEATRRRWMEWPKQGGSPDPVLAAKKALAWWQNERLAARLREDFEQLLAKESDPGPFRQAARLFKAGRQGEIWAYSNALRLLRKTRSKAAVPLVLLELIQASRAGEGGWRMAERADAVTILTGKKIDYKTLRSAKAIEEFIESWWFPNKDRVTTNPEKMSPEQLRLVVDQLLKVAGRSFRYPTDQKEPLRADGVLALLHEAVGPDRDDPGRYWFKEELHPVMVPALLAKAGSIDPDRKKSRPLRADKSGFSFEAIPLLAVLCANGEAPILAKITGDAQQSAATRLLCLLALHAAGESITTRPLLTILKDSRSQEIRRIAAAGLSYCRDRKAADAAVIALLDDRDEEVQAIAVRTIGERPAKDALPKLVKMLEQSSARSDIRALLQAVARAGTRDAQVALARALEAALTDTKQSWRVYVALSAFEKATRQRWIEAGAHDDDYYRKKAKTALEWWKTQQQ